MKVISVEKEEVISELKGHDDTVNGLVISHDNAQLYSIGSDGLLRIWR